MSNTKTPTKPSKLFIIGASVAFLVGAWFLVDVLEKKTDNVLVQYESIDGYTGPELSQSNQNKVDKAESELPVTDGVHYPICEPADPPPLAPEQPSEPDCPDTIDPTVDASEVHPTVDPTVDPEPLPAPPVVDPVVILQEIEYLGQITSVSGDISDRPTLWEIRFGNSTDRYVAWSTVFTAEILLHRVAFKLPDQELSNDHTAIVWLFIEHQEPIRAVDVERSFENLRKEADERQSSR